LSAQAAAVAAPAARVERRRALAGAGLLSAAMVGSGVLAYAFLVLAARTLGPEAYGHIGVLWAAMFIGVIVLFRPLEQTTARAVADRRARGTEVRTVIRSISAIYVAILVVGAIGAVFAWSIVRDRLFLGSDFLTAMLFAGTAVYGLEYVLRGMLAGGRWFKGYAVCLMADAIARLAVAIPLVVVASENLAAAAVAAAGLGGFLVPLLLGRRWLRELGRRGEGTRFDLSAAMTFAAPASIIAAADQILTNGGPLLVMLAGGSTASKAAGVVFAATMLVRIPVYVFQGVAASLLPNLTHLHAMEDTALFRKTLQRAAGVLVLTTAVMGGFAWIAGPRAMGTLYGSGFEAGHAELGLLGLGVGFYLAAATCSQALLAVDRGAQAAAAWTASAVTFLGLYAVLGGDQLSRIALAFAIGTALCVVLVVALLVRRFGRR
jgi:O-antigen/teichoic acid export membrane protein